MQKQVGSISYVFWIIAALSVASSWFITTDYFPYTGLSIIFLAGSSLFYFLKRPKTIFNSLLYITALLLSIFLVLRANEFLTLLNILTLLAMNFLLVNNINGYTFLKLVTTPLSVLDAFFKTSNHFKQKDITGQIPLYEKLKNFRFTQVIVSIVVTVILLSFIVPLLSSANPLFDRIVRGFLDTFNLKEFFDSIFQGLTVLRLILSIIFFVIISRLASYVYLQEPHEPPNKASIIEDAILILPKIITAIIICIFAITQVQLYFASAELLRSLNYTNSKLVNEVFGQLSVVSLIVFLLIYNGRNKGKISRILDYILIGEGLFLTFVGFKSDYDYSSLYGFTQKRLYGFAVVFWIFGTYLLYITNYIRKLKPTTFISRGILLTCFTIVSINFLNFDNLIYNFRKPSVNNKTDYKYFSTLSTDARYHKDAVDSLNAKINKYGQDLDTWPKEEGFNDHRTIEKIQYLQKKYKNLDFRVFNLSEYKAYLTVKGANVEKYNKILYPNMSGTLYNSFYNDLREVETLTNEKRMDEALVKASVALSHAQTPYEKARAYYWMGYINRYLGNMASAESDLNLAIELGPRLPGPYAELSSIQMGRGNFQRALELAQKCVEIDPNYAWCQNRLGIALLNLGRRDEGIAYLEKAVSLDPNDDVLRDDLNNNKIR